MDIGSTDPKAHAGDRHSRRPAALPRRLVLRWLFSGAASRIHTWESD